jgi:hypothetical protein
MKKRTVGIIIIGVIIVLEVSLRLFFTYDHVFRPAIYRQLPVVNYGYVPDTSFILSGERYYINRQGFIGDDYIKETPDSFRIAILGSSMVSGTVNLNRYYSFCPALQRKFSENNIKVKVLNCGVDGIWRNLENFKSIKYQVLDFKPDMILSQYELPFGTKSIIRDHYKGYTVSYPLNDTVAQNDAKKVIDRFCKYEFLISLSHHSFIIKYLVKYCIDHSKSEYVKYLRTYQFKVFTCGDFKPEMQTMEESVAMVHHLKKELEEANIQFFYFQTSKDEKRIKLARENHLPLISLGVSFSREDYMRNDGHLNGAGCEKVADRFYELITKYRLIPGQYYGELSGERE